MNLILICCLALLLHHQADAQKPAYGRTLIWSSRPPGTGPEGTGAPPPFPGRNPSERIIQFDGTKNKNSGAITLPVYHDVLFAPELYPGHFAIITEMKFSSLDPEELALVNNNIVPDFEIKPWQQWVKSRGDPALQISFTPLRRNPLNGTIEKLTSFTYAFQKEAFPSGLSGASIRTGYADNSVLGSGIWVMIKTTEDGIYKLTYNDLIQMGIESPSNVRIFGNGNRMLPKLNGGKRFDDLIENRIYVHRRNQGTFAQGDYILFYGQGSVAWNYNESSGLFEHEPHLYSDGSYYFITSGASGKERIGFLPAPAQTPTKYVNEFDKYLAHEENLVNLLKSGRTWFGEHFRIITSVDYRFVFPNLNKDRPVSLKWKAAARSPVSSSFKVDYNSVTIDQLSFPPVNTGSVILPYAAEREGLAGFNAAGDNITLSVKYMQNTASAEGWLDFIVMNARCRLTMSGSQMHFRDSESVGEDQVAEFRLSGAPVNTRIWKISDPLNISEVITERSGSSLIFKDHTGVLNEYVAFDEENYLSPEIIGRIPNQNLHGIRLADMVVVAPPVFMPAASRLAAHRRRNDGLEVVVVTPQQIYNEFSSGKKDVSAIRDFMKMLYDRAGGSSTMPRYLLLFGNGTYDNRPGDPSGLNFIPTYQSMNSLVPTQSFVSDDFFGLLDDDEGEFYGLLDIGIGRLPVTTEAQAQSVVSKIIDYNSAATRGDWQNILCFVGDDGDNNIHMRDADLLAEGVKGNYPVYNVEKIYLDAWQKTGTSIGQRYPDVNIAISERIRKGVLIMNYTGHGNELRLADENILDINDAFSLKNKDRLPVFMTATCEFSRFDNPDRISAGEMLLLNPNGGSVALFSTTRLVYATPNFFLNQNFYRFVLEKSENGRDMRLGDVMRLTKINTGSGINKRNFTLLGDPSMRLAIPEHSIVITAVNETPVAETTDTLKALSRVSISGQVVDGQGILQESFGGLVFNTVYDKENEERTLGNDGESPFSFKTRNKTVYKGKSSVTGGKFSFSFIVPKDIAYHYGNGRISSYATGGETNAAGFFNDIIIGGSDTGAPADTDGPVIELYMNDRAFISGGLTDQDPLLLAFLSDSSGINTVGGGIGHDITMQVNNNTPGIIVLNDYYIADTDSYQKGTIEYPFSDLDEGNYRIRLKAWDVFNNSSEAILEFLVSESAELALKHVFNYPNPFTGNTSFHFEHNQPSTDIDVLIQIFTVTGKLVRSLSTSIFTPGYKPAPIPWDGLDEFGDRIGRGVYIYRVRIRTGSGQTAEKYEKLVILR
jgi:hypothetical protein